MSARKRFMSRTTTAVDRLVAELALPDVERSEVYSALSKYNRECGCAQGGFATASALVAVIAYFGVTQEFGWRLLAVAFALVFAAAALGKAVGLLLASARLVLLRRSLARRMLLVEGRRDVYLH
jgi:hypothetical protein